MISALAKIAAANDLSEVEVERDGLRIRVARERQRASATHVVAYAAPAIVAAAPAPAAEAAAAPAEHPGAVKSPMVGTAYLRASPDAKAVRRGRRERQGRRQADAGRGDEDLQRDCRHARRQGRPQILVEDGAPVEYGQALMVIE